MRWIANSAEEGCVGEDVVGPAIDKTPTRDLYVGTFLTALALVQFDRSVTRVLHVTLWAHEAWMTSVIATFGVAIGAILVQLRSRRTATGGEPLLAQSALASGVLMVIAFAAQLQLPLVTPGQLAASVLLTMAPFLCAGIVSGLVIAHSPASLPTLLAAGLAGAAAGELASRQLLDIVDAPSAVLLAAAVATTSAVAFATSGSQAERARRRTLRLVTAGVAFVLALVGAINSSTHWIDLRWLKGKRSESARYERWSASAHVTVSDADSEPLGWGISPVYNSHLAIEQLWLNVDAAASAVVTKFDGFFERLGHLRFDITALAHYLRTGRSALVIGVGGGREILTALAFGQREVVAVEANAEVLELLQHELADLSGNLATRPDVRLVHDDPRRFLARSSERFSLIQVSMWDTWPATTAGANVLTEDRLFTREGWRALLEHLESDGILTVSRYYVESEPAATLRLAALATASLRDLGIGDARAHILLLRTQAPRHGAQAGVATILVGRRPFTAEEIKTIETVASPLGFLSAATPQRAESPELEQITDAARYDAVVATYAFNVAAPTDDAPYFDQLLRWSTALSVAPSDTPRAVGHDATRVLAAALVALLALGTAVIAAPVMLAHTVRSGASSLLALYFATAGLGLGLITTGQLQLWLTFPTAPPDSLPAARALLLAVASIVALLAERVAQRLPFALLTVILSLTLAMNVSASSAPLVRLLGGGLSFLALGSALGLTAALGLVVATRRSDAPIVWYWAIHCAAATFAAALATTTMIFLGITATIELGLATYALAALALTGELGLATSHTGDR